MAKPEDLPIPAAVAPYFTPDVPSIECPDCGKKIQLAGDVVGFPQPQHRSPSDIAYRQATGNWPPAPAAPTRPYPMNPAMTLEILRNKLLEGGF